jgi:hypothetical protein
MRVEIKNAISPAENENAYNRDRRAKLLILKNADANREEQRRISFALIDSTVHKWRYPAKP